MTYTERIGSPVERFPVGCRASRQVIEEPRLAPRPSRSEAEIDFPVLAAERVQRTRLHFRPGRVGRHLVEVYTQSNRSPRLCGSRHNWTCAAWGGVRGVRKR